MPTVLKLYAAYNKQLLIIKTPKEAFEYEAGSFETLRKLVELNDGITILPEVATFELLPKQQLLVREFKSPAPMREVSLVVHRDILKKRLLDLVKEEIINNLPKKLHSNKKKNVIAIT